MTIHADGRVAWVGRENVASLGSRVGRIAPTQLRALERKLATIDLDRTLPICSSTSHAIITLRIGDTEQRIDNAHCPPVDAALEELEQMIDELAGTRDWR